MLRSRVLAAGVAALATLAPAVLAPTSALADDGSHRTVATGHDVSYPQCGRTLPQRGDIAVVGVNAGVGTTTNPCLAEQLAWGDAPGPDGGTRLADVYVNTANPGHRGGWWPSSDLTRTGLPVPDPYGTCRGAEDEACAYVYGWSIAADDAWQRGVTRPAERMWWLDVETMNSWSWDRSANLAVLEGMTDALRSFGARVGVYSTTRQWSLITGRATPSGAMAGLSSWIAGATTRAGAEANCDAAPLLPGGRTALAQWVQDGQDHDVSCAPGVVGSTPRLVGAVAVGSPLAAETGRWGPDGTAVRVEWLLDGLPVASAEDGRYTPAEADEGRRLAVRVTGTRPGAPNLVLESAEAVVLPRPEPASPPPSPTGTPTPSATPSATPSPATTTPTDPAALAVADELQDPAGD